MEAAPDATFSCSHTGLGLDIFHQAAVVNSCVTHYLIGKPASLSNGKLYDHVMSIN